MLSETVLECALCYEKTCVFLVNKFNHSFCCGCMITLFDIEKIDQPIKITSNIKNNHAADFNKWCDDTNVKNKLKNPLTNEYFEHDECFIIYTKCLEYLKEQQPKIILDTIQQKKTQPNIIHVRDSHNFVIRSHNFDENNLILETIIQPSPYEHIKLIRINYQRTETTISENNVQTLLHSLTLETPEIRCHRNIKQIEQGRTTKNKYELFLGKYSEKNNDEQLMQFYELFEKIDEKVIKYIYDNSVNIFGEQLTIETIKNNHMGCIRKHNTNDADDDDQDKHMKACFCDPQRNEQHGTIGAQCVFFDENKQQINRDIMMSTFNKLGDIKLICLCKHVMIDVRNQRSFITFKMLQALIKNRISISSYSFEPDSDTDSD